jgi:hypothetical protein
LGGNLLMQAASTAHTLGGHLLGKERHLGESESARTEVWAGPDCWVFFFCQVLFLYWLWPWPKIGWRVQPGLRIKAAA